MISINHENACTFSHLEHKLLMMWMNFFKAREIEKSLQEKLAQTEFCGEYDRNTEAEIQSKMRLKSISRELVASVLASSSVDRLRASLQVS
jgi:hypothetical protein